MSLLRVNALRALMASQPTALAAYIIPTADAHNSEYIAPVDARREWISGFTGSAGTAVVTMSDALMWTDGRYYRQFELEADLTLWTLMKESLPDTPTLEKWLTQHLKEGSTVGVDPYTMTREEWTLLQTALSKANMTLLPIGTNLVDEVRWQMADPPPKRPNNKIEPLDIKYTGKTVGDKIKEIREKMEEKKAYALVISALDEIAYTLNLRGSDIEYNPVLFSYVVVTSSRVSLYWGGGVCSDDVTRHLRAEGADVSVHAYGDIVKDLQDLAVELSEKNEKRPIWVTSTGSEAIHRAASGADVLEKPITVISEFSPVALLKLIKNDVELKGFRDCHIRDGTAVVRALHSIHRDIKNGVSLTEISVVDLLLDYRKQEADFMGESFGTIAGSGSNGAIIHYHPSRKNPVAITSEDMLLIDSGGQYRDGTTDITRTRHLGTPSAEHKNSFTRVLKGQMMLGAVLFPQGVKGNVLDSLARKSLWDVGLDFGHGTGHGVGHYLCVHEGPTGVSWRPYPNDPGIKPGQILSNEPGYYKVDHYGIRHEDLVETIAVNKDSDHPRAKDLVGDFDGRGVIGFNTLTMVPHQKHCIEVSLLNDFELNYLNAYHKKVFDTLGPILKSRGLNDVHDWLQEECAPLTRN